MFTGLVQALGTVRAIVPDGAGGRTLQIAAELHGRSELGESIAVNGCCLTLVQSSTSEFTFQVGPETLAKTNLGHLEAGHRVNLERSLRLNDRLGGHFVTGHIDGTGHIDQRQRQGEWETIWFAAPESLMMQMVPKGCIAVDGISLTLVEVAVDRFSAMLIPHTLSVTTLGFKNVGDSINLETDLIGKYVAKCMTAYQTRSR